MLITTGLDGGDLAVATVLHGRPHLWTHYLHHERCDEGRSTQAQRQYHHNGRQTVREQDERAVQSTVLSYTS